MASFSGNAKVRIEFKPMVRSKGGRGICTTLLSQPRSPCRLWRSWAETIAYGRLRELRRGLIDAGREVVALAPTMSAVLELEAVGFTKAVTVERIFRISSFRFHTAIA